MPLAEIDQAPRPEIPAWLEEVAVIPGEFPMEKMREVWASGDELEDVLVAYLEWMAGPDLPGLALPEHHWLHFIAFYLLSDRGSPRLFEPLLRICYNESYMDLLLGDSITEDLPAWLRVSGREREDNLRTVVEDNHAPDLLRIAAFGALGGMAWEGSSSREDYIAYLRRLPDFLTPEKSIVWDEWYMQVIDFGLEDQLDRIAEASRKGFIDRWVGSAENAEVDFSDPQREKQAESNLLHKKPGGTAGLKEFATFLCFKPGYWEGQARWEAKRNARYAYGSYQPVAQVIRQEPKIGRNDPCPCGSGKKWKKCCAP